MKRFTPGHLTGLVLALGFSSAVLAAAEPAPVTSESFATGWQSATHPLFLRGPSERDVSRNVWMVSGMTPRGHYVLIHRVGDKAEVVPGHDFTVDSDPVERIYVLLPPAVFDVEAMPVSYLPPKGAAAAKSMPTSDSH